jgi:hypothetical protein
MTDHSHLPFKLALAADLLDGPMSRRAVFAAIRSRYAGSGICADENIDAALRNLRLIGIISMREAGDDTEFELTGHGRKRVLDAL